VGKSCRNDGLQTKKATGEKNTGEKKAGEKKKATADKKATDKPTEEKSGGEKRRQTNRPGENRRFGNGHKKRKHGIGLLSGFQSFLTNLKLLT